MDDTPACELPVTNASQAEMDALMAGTRTIAVVGLSPNPNRPSHDVAAYLQRAGYMIIPVNPGVDTVLGEKAYPSLEAVPGPVDLVDIFRRPEEIPAVVDAAIAKGARGVWMQLGLAHNAAADKARAAGLTVVINRCLKVEHRRWQGA